MGIEDVQRELDECVRALGDSHPRALALRRKLARAYYEARDFVPALEHHERVLAELVRVLGADDSITVSTLADLAHIWFAGWMADSRPEQAIPLFELAVAEWVRVAGVNDRETLSARNDLATAYLAAGQATRALAVFEQALADCRHVLGGDHTLTRLVRDNLEGFAKLRSAVATTADREQNDTAMAQEIASAFSSVLGLEPAVAGGRVSVVMPTLGETLSLPVCDVKRVTKSFAPTGDAALEFVMTDGDGVRPLIVLADNVVFAPEDPVVVLQAPIPVVIPNAPPLTSYVEMVADAERFAMTAGAAEGTDDGGVAGRTLRLSGGAATCLLLRCVIAGAVRFGLRSLPAVAWWRRGWAAGAAGWNLPPFPRDPVWDHLTRCAARLPMTPSVTAETTDISAGVSALTIADFESLKPRLSVVGLDEEFVEIWKALLPITPAGFAALLLERLSGAQAHVALYPGGAGSVNVLIQHDGIRQALLQLRFDLHKDEMHIAEIRIAEDARGTGLFQRLEHNTEQLATALGLGSVHVHATEKGTLAFARFGFPRDPELREKVHGPG